MKYICLLTTLLICSCANNLAHEQIIEKNTFPANLSQDNSKTINQVKSFWQKPFQDKQLGSLIQESYNNNLSIKQAWLNLKIANANFKISKAQDDITLHLQADNESINKNYKNKKSETETTTNIDLVLNWQIDLWGKINKYAKAEEFEYQASKQEVMQTYQLLAYQVINNYLNYQTTLENLELNKQLLKDFENKYTYLTKLSKTKIKTTQLNSAKIELNKQLLVINNLNIELEALKNNIAILLNKKTDQLTIEKSNIKLENSEEFIAIDLEKSNYLLQAAKLRIFKHANKLQASKLEKLPSLNLTLKYGYERHNLNEISKASVLNSLTSLTMPLLNNKSISQAIKVAESEKQLAVLKYLELSNQIINNLQTSYKSLTFSFNSFKTQNQNLLLSKNNKLIYQALYNSGQEDYLSLLQAKQDFIIHKIDLNNNKKDYLQQLTNTYNTIGFANLNNKDLSNE